jgi:hypothetical protein
MKWFWNLPHVLDGILYSAGGFGGTFVAIALGVLLWACAVFALVVLGLTL